MDEMGLLLIPSITDKHVTVDAYEKKDNKGNAKRTVDYFTELGMVFVWINAEKPDEIIECKWYGQGVDTAGEKGVGKALTYAEKYFMLKFFNIPTDKDDPDSFQAKQDDFAPPPVPSTIEKNEILILKGSLTKTKTDEKKFLNYYKVSKPEQLTPEQYVHAMSVLKQKEDKPNE